ncbi:MAG: hypothetical protein WAZ14_01010 [Patescibacteria group bacterium]
MFKTYLHTLKQRGATQIVSFGQAVGDVFQALGWWGIPFLAAQIALGLLPLALILTLGDTVDAMNGARGIGVITSDLNAALSRWLIILLITFAAYLFSLRFTGKAGEVGRGLRELVIFGVLLSYLLGINQALLAILAGLVLLADVLWSQVMRVRLVGLCVLVLAGSLAAHAIIKFTVLRSFTVGEGLTMVTGIVMLVVCLKLRIAKST